MAQLSDEMVVLIANTAIENYKGEIRKDQKARQTDKKKKTTRMLKAYRRVKSMLNDEGRFTEEEMAQYRWRFLEDLMGSPRDSITRTERIMAEEDKRREEDLYTLYRIDNAMKLYEEECNMAGTEEDKRRCFVISKMYIEDEASDVNSLAEMLSVSDKTIYRDIGIATDILSFYLFGA